jgi:hypothetical protein
VDTPFRAIMHWATPVRRFWALWPTRYSRLQPTAASQVHPPHVTAVAIWARAIGLARNGHAAGARQEVEKLRQLERQLRASGEDYAEYWAKQVEIQKVEAMAWSAQAEGEADEARNMLRKAADDEDAFEKLPVTPGPVIPARAAWRPLTATRSAETGAEGISDFPIELSQTAGRHDRRCESFRGFRNVPIS